MLRWSHDKQQQQLGNLTTGTAVLVDAERDNTFIAKSAMQGDMVTKLFQTMVSPLRPSSVKSHRHVKRQVYWLQNKIFKPDKAQVKIVCFSLSNKVKQYLLRFQFQLRNIELGTNENTFLELKFVFMFRNGLWILLLARTPRSRRTGTISGPTPSRRPPATRKPNPTRFIFLSLTAGLHSLK